jgi:uroporphyrinogen decarboxylase
MKELTKRERVRAAINREPVDRVPYAFWRHFPDVDRSAPALAQATLRFHERYGSDFVKITPSGGYAVQEWGCVESVEVRPDGHRPCESCAVRSAEDWRRIRPLDPGAAAGYVDQIETIIRMGFDRRIDCPVMPTLFSPLSLARKLSGDRLNADLRQHPELVKAALEAITETLIRFADLALTEGVTGIFYSIQAASRSLHSEEEYLEFGEPYDRQVLESVEGRSELTIVHCHGDQLMFDRLANLPGHAWNWDDRATPPSLRDARSKVNGALIGGLHQWKTLRDGTPEQAVAEVQDAIDQTGSLGLVIGPGCVLPAGTPDANVAAVVSALGGTLKRIPGVAP